MSRLDALITPLIFLFLTTSGCVTYRVSAASGLQHREFQRVPGIPFYARSANCRQETIYQQDVRKLTLVVHEISADGKPVAADHPFFSSSIVVPGRIVQNPDFPLRSLGSIQLNSASVTQLVAQFQNLSEFTAAGWQTDPNLLLVSNTTTPVQAVDYSRVFFLNAVRPPIGSVTVSAELNADGTLSKGSAEVEDRTVDALLDLIPVKEVLLSRWIPSEDKNDLQPETTFRAILTIEPSPILHTLSRVHELTSPCAQHARIPENTETGIAYTRVLSSAVPRPASVPNNAINLSGQITMPEKKP